MDHHEASLCHLKAETQPTSLLVDLFLRLRPSVSLCRSKEVFAACSETLPNLRPQHPHHSDRSMQRKGKCPATWASRILLGNKVRQRRHQHLHRDRNRSARRPTSCRFLMTTLPHSPKGQASLRRSLLPRRRLLLAPYLVLLPGQSHQRGSNCGLSLAQEHTFTAKGVSLRHLACRN